MDGDSAHHSGLSFSDDSDREWNYEDDSFESESSPENTDEYLDMEIRGHHISPPVAGHQDFGTIPNSSSEDLRDTNEADSDWDEDLTFLAASGDNRANFAEALQRIMKHCSLDTLSFSFVSQAQSGAPSARQPPFSCSKSGPSTGNKLWTPPFETQSGNPSESQVRCDTGGSLSVASVSSTLVQEQMSQQVSHTRSSIDIHTNQAGDQRSSPTAVLNGNTEENISAAQAKRGMSSPKPKSDLSLDSLSSETRDGISKTPRVKSLTPESLLSEGAEQITNQSRTNSESQYNTDSLREKKSLSARVRRYVHRKFSAFRRCLICGENTQTRP